MQVIDDVAIRERVPTRWSGLVFEAKAWGWRLIRVAREVRDGRPPKHRIADDLRDAPVIAAFEGALWPTQEADTRLVAGKIHNLRLAAVALHGLEIPAGKTFSFWRQLGRASARRGFVAGRELREGCIVPAIGGGLCQLTNAIHDCALRAGFEIVERHRHSRVLPGSLAELDRDATVFWNYLDLRLRADFAWRVDVTMDASSLSVQLRAHANTPAAPLPTRVQGRPPTAPNDCGSCNENECHRHTGPADIGTHRSWLVDEPWPEFREHLRATRADGDRVLDIAASAPSLRLRAARAAGWLRWRIGLWRGEPIPKARTGRHARVAEALARCLRPDDLHLIVSQGLLPYLWDAGVLAGRRFDVLMNALPMTQIQAQLDRAATRHPDSPTLGDFRAPIWLLQAEAEALAAAATWISPHAQVLALAGSRAHPLVWQAPMPVPRLPNDSQRLRVLLAASSLARKGALELREAVKGLPVLLLLPPGASDSPGLWQGLEVRRIASFDEGIAHADLVVLPAWIEHQPRGLLAAIASGIPVVATPACGLPPSLPWQRVEAGDVAALTQTLVSALSRLHDESRPTIAVRQNVTDASV